MAEYKAQHYIPQMYLSRFCDPNSVPDEKPFLWVYERGTSAPFRRAPKKTAVSSYYYSFTDDQGAQHHDIEKHLSHIESKANAVIDRLDGGSNPNELSSDERAYMSAFLAYMGHRVPRFRRHWEDQSAEMMRLVGHVAASNKESFHRMFREMIANGETDPDIDIERVRQFALSDDYEIKTNPDYSLRLMLEISEPVAKLITEFEWRVLRCPDGVRFFASDAPFSMVTTEKLLFPYNQGVGWELPFMEALLPLSPTTALLISQHHPEGEELLSSEGVREANLRTLAFADRQIFAASDAIAEQLAYPQSWDWWTPLSKEVLPRFLK